MIEVPVDDLDKQKLDKVKEIHGEDETNKTLKRYITELIRSLYDNRNNLEVVNNNITFKNQNEKINNRDDR